VHLGTAVPTDAEDTLAQFERNDAGADRLDFAREIHAENSAFGPA